MTLRTQKKRLFAKIASGGSVAVAVALAVILTWSPSATALSGSQFMSGNIIDNGVFFDGSTMSSMDIQNFMNSKVPQCDTYGSQMYSTGQTRAQYGASRGSNAPYTCLKDYRQDTPNMPAENGLCGYFQGGNRSAAQIIRDVGSTCGINPQVLIVLLQKEQSLLTDTWPWPIQYGSATGFGCPDTAPCDPSVAGFFYQVYYAARQFKKYARDANQYSFFRNSVNQVRYNPNAGCGSGNVFLQNQATTNLYIYTPYQPNAAALNNLYGTGDDCSAYGNRNFWRMFNDWFGSTHAAPFAWQPISQSAFYDAARTQPVNTQVLSPNTRYYLRVTALNTGNAVWHNSGGSSNNQVYLATNNPRNRPSAFADNTWPAYHRPSTPNESSVAAGDTGTFDFSIVTPGNYINQNESFNLVAEGQTWFNDVGMYWPITTLPPTPQWQALEQGVYYDAARTKPANTDLLAPNTTYYMRLKLRNQGNTIWSSTGSNPVRLGTSNQQDRASAFYSPAWNASNRAATISQTVAPGQDGYFNFEIRTPSTYGTYREYFRPLAEGQAWMNDLGLYWPLTVAQPTSSWSLDQQSTYTNDSISTGFNTSSTTNDKRFFAVVRARNTGNTTWSNTGENTVRLGTNAPTNRQSSFYDSSWPSADRAATLQEASVAPGNVGTFSFWMRAPYSVNGTNFKEYFRPVIDGKAWFNDIGMHIPVTMQNGSDLSWSMQSQVAYSDGSYTTPINTTQFKTNTTYWFRLKIRNLSGVTWDNGTLKLGTSNPNDRASVFATSSWSSNNRAASLTENKVNPGEIGTFSFPIKTPTQPVSRSEYFRPVIEGQTWLPDIGLYWPIVTTN